MRVWMSRVTLTLGLVLTVSTALFAQGAIGGTVKDSTGAVLPGVSVEASSDALIERTRTIASGGIFWRQDEILTDELPVKPGR